MSAPVITDKGTEVESRLAAYKRINARLLAAVNAVVAAERAHLKANGAFSDNIKSVASDERNASLQAVLDRLGKALSSAEDVRQEYITDRLPDTVIASLAAVKKATISPVAAMIADRQAVKKAFDKANDTYNQLTSSGATTKKRIAAERALIDAERRRANVDARFVENVDRFEFERLDETKRVLTEIVHGRLAYHCRAIEEMSQVASALAAFDPSTGAEELRTTLESFK